MSEAIETSKRRTLTIGVLPGEVLRPRVIVADPPWKFGDSLPGKGRGAAKNYAVMTVEDICACLPTFRVEPAENAVLFLWRVSSMQREALDVVEAWGFKLKSEIVWEKLTSGGLAHFGMGRFVRASHETCLIAERGRCKPAVRNVRSRFTAKTPTSEGGVIHSAKPPEFFDIVRAMYPEGLRVELFARPCHDGFTCIGKEARP